MDLTIPSSLGGAGWRPRTASHADEVAGGVVWSRSGYTSEAAPLRSVVLAEPPSSLSTADPRAWLLRSAVDLPRLRRQYAEIAAAFEAHGVVVHRVRTTAGTPPNVIFMRDLFFTTPQGAIVARPAAAQRAGEERWAARALAEAGVPILTTVAGSDTFEGADALRVDDRTVVVGVGFRTSAGGAEVVRRVLAEQGTHVLSTPLQSGVQHLLGALTIVDDRVAAIRSRVAGPHLREILTLRDYRLIELPDDDEMLGRRGMNLVTLAPGRVLMPSGAPGIRNRLEQHGIATEEINVSEYIKADGGLGCLTGIVHRGPLR